MSTEIILISITNGDQVLYLNGVAIASQEANDTNTSVNLADLGKKIAEVLGASLQSVTMEVPKDPDWTFTDIYALLPARPQTVVVYHGYLKLPMTEQIDVDFAAPSGTTKAETDAAFLGGLAQVADINYLGIGEAPVESENQEPTVPQNALIATQQALSQAMAYAEKLEKFVDGIRRLNIWDWSTDSGEDFNECEKPRDGYEDSHNALMDLIEAARVLGTEPKTEFIAPEPMVEIPTAIIEIEGGVAHNVTTSHPVRIVILDSDTEGAQADDVRDVDGTDYYIHDHQGHAGRCNTEYVKGVLQQIA